VVHRLDFDLGLHRLAAAAADGGGSGDYDEPQNGATFKLCKSAASDY